MGVQITAFEIERVKKIKVVSIDASSFTVIGGRNKQGKTSILSSIAWALGGDRYKPSNPNNREFDEPGHIKLTLSNGITVERKGKTGRLIVTDPSGKKSGMALLKQFISPFALDISPFLNANDKEKARTLLQLIGVGDQLQKLEAEETRLYNLRHAHGQIADRKAKYAKELPSYPDVGIVEQSTNDLEVKKGYILKHNSEFEARATELQELESERDAINIKITRHQSEIKQVKEQISSLPEYAEIVPDEDTTEIEEQIRTLQEQLNAMRQRNAERQRRRDDQAAFNMKMTNYKNIIENRKDTILVLQDSAKSIEAKIEKLNRFSTTPLTTDDIDKELQRIKERNEMIRANIHKHQAAQEAMQLQAEYDNYTSEIESIRDEIIKLLDNAKLPLPGLTVRNGNLLYNGDIWDCMSGSDQLKVAAAIAQSINPECRFVLIDKLEGMDSKTREEFAEWADSQGLQVIATLVTSDPGECTIYIEDGLVKQSNDLFPEEEK